MSRQARDESVLAELVSASEALVGLLERRDPRYIEQIERRHALLAELEGSLALTAAARNLRAVLERVRQLGGAAEREARAMRLEIIAEMASLDSGRRFAESLSRLASPHPAGFVDIEG